MPELPEVETMVRGLRPAMLGRTVIRAEVHDPRLLHGVEVAELESRLRGAVVERVERRGKWVVIQFRGDSGVIVIQPRMTGGFWLVPPDRPSHVRLTFELERPGGTVWYCDSRRLGRLAWHPDDETASDSFRHSHGPDALAITATELRQGLRQTSRAVKPALMDQKVLAGVGNIYADEVLHRASVHPERSASLLTGDEVFRIHRAIGEVLAEAIEAEGSSFDQGYRTVLGQEGGFLSRNAVYGRGGEPCPGCGGPIVKTRIAGLAGRPTHYCPKCQPALPKRRPRRE
jgi:formamidopyrimidine-DNA glycosylase